MNNTRSWSKRAGEIARSYLANVEELAGRRQLSNRRRSVAMQKSRGVSKPVEAAALRIAADRRIDQLEREVEAVEWAFSVLREIRGGEDVAAVAEMMYITRYKVSPERAAYQFGADVRTIYRYNRMFLKLVAARIGLWSPPK